MAAQGLLGAAGLTAGSGSGLGLGAGFMITIPRNDAVDAQFDTQYRRERPVPSGAIQAQTVWLFSAGWLAAGMLILATMGRTPFALSLILLACINCSVVAGRF